MAVTRTKRLEQIRSAEQAGEITPDTSLTICPLPGGWRIAYLATAGDVRREGRIMRSCLAKYLGDTDINGKEGIYEPAPGVPNDAPPPRISPEMIAEHDDLKPRHAAGQLYSLRDPDNVPRLTFWLNCAGYAISIYGTRNCEPAPKLRAKMDEWQRLHASEVTRVCYERENVDDRGILTMFDGLFTSRGIELQATWRHLVDLVEQTPVTRPHLIRLQRSFSRRSDKQLTLGLLSIALLQDKHAWEKLALNALATGIDGDETLTAERRRVLRAALRANRRRIEAVERRIKRYETEMFEMAMPLLARTRQQRKWYGSRKRSRGQRGAMAAGRYRLPEAQLIPPAPIPAAHPQPGEHTGTYIYQADAA